MRDELQRRTFALGLRLHRASYSLMLITWGIMAAVFIFERQVEAALQLLGYGSNFVSHFAFIRNQYYYLINSGTLPNVSVAHFHMIEIATWLAVVVASTVFLPGAAILLWSDNAPYRLSYDMIVRLKAGKRLKLICGFFILFPLAGFVLSSMPTQSKAKPFFLIMKDAPRLYFFMLSAAYSLFAWMSALSIMILCWLILWRGRTDRLRSSEDNRSREG